MNIVDVKILWGRAANRCSFPDCKIELTPDGGKTTLGEIAHIVAKSAEGPRGESDLPAESRDNYDNLILLCPTHHKTIDNNPEIYTVEKLHQMKQKHEEWVNKQLDKGVITVRSIDNSSFLDLRKKDWFAFVKDYVWVISSITPLDISEDAIDPLRENLLQVFNNLKLPEHSGLYLNKCRTRPNENGVVNEDLRLLQEGYGHQIQIFRTGHCEFLFCLEGNVALEKSTKARVLPYDTIVDCFMCEIQGLNQIWNQGLSFSDMLLSILITNTASTCLHHERQTDSWTPPLGPKVSLNILEYNTVINKSTDVVSVVEAVVKRFVNYFGLVLDNLFDQTGRIVKPRPLF